MHDALQVPINPIDAHLIHGNLQDILYDIQVGKDVHIPYPIIPSPVDSEMHFLSAGSSTMSHSSMSPSVCDYAEESSMTHFQSSSAPHSYPLENRRPTLAPLSITHGPRYTSPWSAVEGSSAYTDLRRGSLPSLRMDHSLQADRPVTAPLSHVYSLQSARSDQDDLFRFAYDVYGSTPQERHPMAASTFASVNPSSQQSDFFYGTTTVNEDSLQSRPSTRGEYPAYVTDCQETIHTNPPQLYVVDPTVISGASRVEPFTKENPSNKSSVQQCDDTEDMSRVLTPSPITTHRRSPTRGKAKASPIIETYKNGVVPPIKRRGKLPKATTELLKTWLYDHAQHPYPTEEEKRKLCALTGLTFNQVSNWMINARRRILPTRCGGNMGSQKPVSQRGNTRFPSSSLSSSGEFHHKSEHVDSIKDAHQVPSPSTSWSPAPVSVTIHTPNTFYTNVRSETYTTPVFSPTSQPQQNSLVGCVTTSEFYPTLSAGGNPFNYHGSTDSNILSRSLIDSKHYIHQTYSSATEQSLVIKKEQVAETLL